MSLVGLGESRARDLGPGAPAPVYRPGAARDGMYASDVDPLWVHVLVEYSRMGSIAPHLKELYKAFRTNARSVVVSSNETYIQHEGVPDQGNFSAAIMQRIPNKMPRIIDGLFFADSDERQAWYENQRNAYDRTVRKVSIQNAPSLARAQSPAVAAEIAEVREMLRPVFGKGVGFVAVPEQPMYGFVGHPHHYGYPSPW